MRYCLRTLLIVLALLPPIVATVVPPLLQWFRMKSPTDIPAARVYPLSQTDPAVAVQMVKAKLPGLTVAFDSASNSLFVAGQPADHTVVAAIIKQLEQGPPTSTSDVLRPVKLRQVKLKAPPATSSQP